MIGRSNVGKSSLFLGPLERGLKSLGFRDLGSWGPRQGFGAWETFLFGGPVDHFLHFACLRLNKISQFGTVARVSSMPGQTKEAAWYRNKKVKVDFIDAWPAQSHRKSPILHPEPNDSRDSETLNQGIVKSPQIVGGIPNREPLFKGCWSL